MPASRYPIFAYLITTPGTVARAHLVILVHDGMAAAAADQPAVDRDGERERDRQRHQQAPPEQAVREAGRRPITASSGRIVSPYPNVKASMIESTIEAALPSPIAVAITIPSTSPIAQPVRQCRVAARARRQTS